MKHINIAFSLLLSFGSIAGVEFHKGGKTVYSCATVNGSQCLVMDIAHFKDGKISKIERSLDLVKNSRYYQKENQISMLPISTN